ncbi:hypothetical protein GUJ93_ZPchr0013g34893 [Zizania palustris]|uniref:Uncharacterized protein n=1 Tax=Zizania palustris TaxID=103762 RepID=A0A8J5WYK7_ZIZPA|nr:hypothetical protein GUJ93_ZPchr0013g34893 [Zizania palustris]
MQLYLMPPHHRNFHRLIVGAALCRRRPPSCLCVTPARLNLASSSAGGFYRLSSYVLSLLCIHASLVPLECLKVLHLRRMTVTDTDIIIFVCSQGHML